MRLSTCVFGSFSIRFYWMENGSSRSEYALLWQRLLCLFFPQNGPKAIRCKQIQKYPCCTTEPRTVFIRRRQNELNVKEREMKIEIEWKQKEHTSSLWIENMYNIHLNVSGGKGGATIIYHFPDLSISTFMNYYLFALGSRHIMFVFGMTSELWKRWGEGAQEYKKNLIDGFAWCAFAFRRCWCDIWNVCSLDYYIL